MYDTSAHLSNTAHLRRGQSSGYDAQDLRGGGEQCACMQPHRTNLSASRISNTARMRTPRSAMVPLSADRCLCTRGFRGPVAIATTDGLSAPAVLIPEAQLNAAAQGWDCVVCAPASFPTNLYLPSYGCDSQARPLINTGSPRWVAHGRGHGRGPRLGSRAWAPLSPGIKQGCGSHHT